MIIIYGVASCIVLGYLYFNYAEIISEVFFHSKGFEKFQKRIMGYGFNYSFSQHLILCIAILLLILFCGYLFSLHAVAILSLTLISLVMFPILLLWQIEFAYQQRMFNHLTTYLQQFIALFKVNPKAYAALQECQKIDYGSINKLVEAAITEIESGKMSQVGLDIIGKKYPHFIIHNLHVLVETVEIYGSVQYREGLDLIQDDIDDWIEDIYIFKQQQISLKNKILLLCGLSTFIAFMAKRMLASVEISTLSGIYQMALYLFLILILFTVLMAHRIYRQPWIDSGENIC